MFNVDFVDGARTSVLPRGAFGSASRFLLGMSCRRIQSPSELAQRTKTPQVPRPDSVNFLYAALVKAGAVVPRPLMLSYGAMPGIRGEWTVLLAYRLRVVVRFHVQEC